MPSAALVHWDNHASDRLDEIEAAHQAVGGTGRGRRYGNHAYTVLLSSQFQGFCRNLHSEAADCIAANTTPATASSLIRLLLTQGRKLDQGNPNPSNLGADFGRLGMQFWTQLDAVDRRRRRRQATLESLNKWRNAIAHQDWSEVGPNIQIAAVRRFRAVCNALSTSFDRAVYDHLFVMVGRPPW